MWKQFGKKKEKTDDCIDALISLSHATIGVVHAPAASALNAAASALGDEYADNFYGFSRKKTIWGKKAKVAIAESDFTLSKTREGLDDDDVFDLGGNDEASSSVPGGGDDGYCTKPKCSAVYRQQNKTKKERKGTEARGHCWGVPFKGIIISRLVALSAYYM